MRIFQPQRLVALRSYTGEKGRTQLEKNTFIWAHLFFSILYTDEREREKEALDRRKVFADFSTAFIISLTGK
uniref:Uncharacterized protein n=1 Tax=Noccaea caerulescens TaxID=107243 RepID=A0A1J3HD96_NOCCA